MHGENRHLIERAAKGLLESSYAIALTGAGISTESDISDFLIQGKTGDILPRLVEAIRLFGQKA